MKSTKLSADSVVKFALKYKYVLIAIAAGTILLMLPRTTSGQARDAPLTNALTSAELAGYGKLSDDSASEVKLEELLSRLEGAGEVTIALSSSGAVVMCANVSPELKLSITQAVSAYTGLSSDRIIILKARK
ncbi:MAG: hypothetical protein LBC65_01315 [Oscillospiraceae bacterium]|nr:hypothetical protein [Oscillospiraceae bacterium]